MNRAGNMLRRLGVQEEQRVLIALPDSPEFVAAYFGAIKIGRSPCQPTRPCSRTSMPTASITAVRACSSSTPTCCRASNRFCATARFFVASSPLDPRPRVPELEGVSGEGERGSRSGADEQDEIAFWLWTSGQHGRAKGCRARSRRLDTVLRVVRRSVLDIHEHDVTFSSSKLFHAYGLGNRLMFPFTLARKRSCAPGKASPAVVLATVDRERPSLFSRFRRSTRRCCETEQNNPYSFDSVRLAVSAAEPLPADIFIRWQKRFQREILDGIGSTEMLHIYLSARAGKVKPGSAGQPDPGYDLRILDKDRARRRRWRDWRRCACVARARRSAIWNRRHLSRERMRGRMVRNGRQSVSRSRRLLLSTPAGRTTCSSLGRMGVADRAGARAFRTPCRARSCCHAVPGRTRSDEADGLRGVEVVRECHRGACPRAQAFVKDRVTHYKCPRRIQFVEQLPKTAAGKIQRFKLRPDAE